MNPLLRVNLINALFFVFNFYSNLILLVLGISILAGDMVFCLTLLFCQAFIRSVFIIKSRDAALEGNKKLTLLLIYYIKIYCFLLLVCILCVCTCLCDYSLYSTSFTFLTFPHFLVLCLLLNFKLLIVCFNLLMGLRS